jgi:hypothetical protein
MLGIKDVVDSIFYKTLHHFAEDVEQCYRAVALGQVGINAGLGDWNNAGDTPCRWVSALLKHPLKQLAKDRGQCWGRFLNTAGHNPIRSRRSKSTHGHQSSVDLLLCDCGESFKTVGQPG